MSERYQRTPLIANGKSKVYSQVHNEENAARRWKSLQFDEWTFTLLLFLFSLSIVIGKLFLNHDFFSFLDISTDRLAILAINRSHPYYKDITQNSVIEPLNRYSWLIKAVLSGLVTTGITWFIIYEDSNVPGVNPPSPFSPSKKRIQESSPVQLNYFVGILNGLLVFCYMCL
ncbi:ADP-ribosylation factor-like protein 6-interacting protein 6 isoform X2 [Phymastichus coffea]|uniref:ADP-ribosylation factor-like protein 6-interacting protein 6 isoform X2 n=1 Tax=Phymastichus coffea TaxID=108790 RepID=UPI00273C24DB|nr:ADP-ribosylation factor-like protein 6-interacting protein 6 isoform X2 [Phymastichus coffea]